MLCAIDTGTHAHAALHCACCRSTPPPSLSSLPSPRRPSRPTPASTPPPWQVRLLSIVCAPASLPPPRRVRWFVDLSTPTSLLPLWQVRCLSCSQYCCLCSLAPVLSLPGCWPAGQPALCVCLTGSTLQSMSMAMLMTVSSPPPTSMQCRHHHVWRPGVTHPGPQAGPGR